MSVVGVVAAAVLPLAWFPPFALGAPLPPSLPPPRPPKKPPPKLPAGRTVIVVPTWLWISSSRVANAPFTVIMISASPMLTDSTPDQQRRSQRVPHQHFQRADDSLSHRWYLTFRAVEQ